MAVCLAEYTKSDTNNSSQKEDILVPDERQLRSSSTPVRITATGLIPLLQISPDALLVIDQAGTIITVNEQTEALFGFAHAELPGQQLEILLPDRFRDAHSTHRERFFSALRTREMGTGLQFSGKRKNGTEFPVDISLRSLLIDDALHVIGAVRDMTEQKRIETEHKRLMQELIGINAALVEANKVRDQFLATISHELRTPLASIIGFSEMLLEDITQAGLGSTLKDDQERILKNAQHLLDLINDVLDLSKIDAGRMDVVFTRVNVRKLLTSVVEETRSIALTQHLSLRVEVEEGLDSLETSELKLHQILLNLVSNALKFTKQGGVTISARRVESPDKEVERVALAVTDTGTGIPADIQERIFEAFYQVDGGYTRKFGGTGLGLAIVRQLTTLLGGTIQIKSAPGQGSTFMVLLPIKAVHQPFEQPSLRLHPTLLPESLATSANREANDEQNNLVLAVDDNPDVIDLIKAAFNNTPYKVVGVTDPSKAMESIEELRPCAITLDVMMPRLNGWQILHYLKDNPAAASIPVIMLSVLSEASTGYVLGADDYLIKPFKRDALVSTLNRLVAARRSAFQATSQAWPT